MAAPSINASAAIPELGDVVLVERYARTAAQPKKPAPVTLRGPTIVLVPYEAVAHDRALYAVFCGAPALGHPAYDADALVWRFSLSPALSGVVGATAEGGAADEPPTAGADPRLPFATFVQQQHARADAPDRRMFVATLAATGDVVGQLALMNNRPLDGVVEIGMIATTPAYQATPVTTEATYLLLAHAFDALGCRRVEWKCDSRNARSRAAAARIGFAFEGVFRKHMVVTGLGAEVRSRDTWWAAIVDDEWPARCEALRAWLISAESAALYARRARQLDALRSEQHAAAGGP